MGVSEIYHYICVKFNLSTMENDLNRLKVVLAEKKKD